MDIRKKNLSTLSAPMTQNSVPTETIKPEDLMSELGIKKDAYYKDLNYLDIKPEKDSESRAYLTNEQADQIRSLRNYVNQTGKREGFTNSSIVKVDDSNLVESSNNNSEEDIYVEAENPLDNLNVNQLLRKAAQLKARELATPELAIRAIADRMSEDDLPDDLKQKVFAVREAVNPKWTPADLADSILSQYRSSRSGS
jgi:signal transduction histidine kinase